MVVVSRSDNMSGHSEEEEHYGGFPKKPCRACSDFKSWMKTQGGGQKKKEGAAASPEEVASPPFAAPPSQCPADREELGRSTWTLLHTTAAYYPQKPTQHQQTTMRQFITSFSRLYPCDHCAEDFRQDLAAHPPAVESGDRLARWFCDRHNTVNRKLGKPEFDCSLVAERWRDGWKDGSCG